MGRSSGDCAVTRFLDGWDALAGSREPGALGLFQGATSSAQVSRFPSAPLTIVHHHPEAPRFRARFAPTWRFAIFPNRDPDRTQMIGPGPSRRHVTMTEPPPGQIRPAATRVPPSPGKQPAPAQSCPRPNQPEPTQLAPGARCQPGTNHESDIQNSYNSAHPPAHGDGSRRGHQNRLRPATGHRQAACQPSGRL